MMGKQLTNTIKSSALEIKMVQRIAKLSSLAVEENELQSYAKDLGDILQWVEQLNEIDVSQVSPMVGTEVAQLRMREDKVTDGNCKEEVLSNAPKRIADFYAVPKVIE